MPLFIYVAFNKMIKQSIVVSLMILLLTGCGSTPRPPVLEASGYIADNGVVRVWQKTSGNNGQPIRLMSVYTPYSGDTVSTYYEYTDGALYLALSEVQRKQGQSVLLRLDEQGNPTFMERQMSDRNEQLSSDDITRIKYQEQKARTMSNTLAAGKIRLYQGQVRNGIITTCAGEVVNVNFPPHQKAWLDKRERNGGDISLAWLSSPQGLELLLVANEDFCNWQPTLENF
ncbi:DUF1481 domain-containing protein [Budvicia aquatica]|uniref:DUF1481 domain-containing protein n=1 Tax=Budvicia aquatica TaxID=82979 RepID=UPI001B606CEE|nr:DUF1481 domain-containing protein [Budvicia aquatica]MBP9643848.1 DUF1481 domain-containing protein [Budvicia sp.]GKX53191.1 hypothetical protein SOASR029_35000 [Budvicia aquatica]